MAGIGKYEGVGNFEMDAPTQYAPFKMKAKNNDPMTKNYGPVAPGKMRAFGTKDSDMPEKVSQKSGTLYTEGGVGNSPVKGWFRDKLKDIGGKHHQISTVTTGDIFDIDLPLIVFLVVIPS